MVETADVYLWSKHIGSVALTDESALMNFRYTDWAIESGVNISPIMMPPKRVTYQFPDLLRSSFNGVPGLIADSLPDKFGNAIINNWLLKQGRSADSFSAIERLCYIGSRGMGALEYKPHIGPAAGRSARVDVDELVNLASSILQQRKDFRVKPSEEEDIGLLLKLGTSAGGARAKAIIAWNRNTNEIRSGQIKAGSGFEYWIMKLDGVEENSDKEKNDEPGYGKIEYAYYLMATACNIEMTESRLFNENGRSHFMTKRFDRTDDGEKLHMQTLSALTHTDYNYSGLYSYEQTAGLIRELTGDQSQVEELFRRMIFNILARNQDDHVKNISFLMDKNMKWRLSPAYDVGFAYNPVGEYTGRHQMRINGKLSDITIEDIYESGKMFGISKSHIDRIYESVAANVRKWEAYAEIAGVSEEKKEKIARTLLPIAMNEKV